MHDIFISYARKDRPIANRLAEKLEQQGWSVWWDPKLLVGSEYRRAILEALKTASSVIVLWSKTSVESTFVQDEAERARRRGVLIPVCIEEVDPPLGFGCLHCAVLSNWDRTSTFHEFNELLANIARVIGRGNPQPTLPGETGASPDAANGGIASAVRIALQKQPTDPLTDEDWATLAELDLSYCHIDDAEMTHLQRGKELQHLDLSGNRIGDLGLRHLTPLRRLRYLDLSNNKGVSDAGLQHLRTMVELTHLNLSNTSVNGKGLSQLSEIGRLCDLLLRGTQITSDVVEVLRCFPCLRRLDLGDTAIGDAAVGRLEHLPDLEYLGLRQTRISFADREKLKRVLSKCKVVG